MDTSVYFRMSPIRFILSSTPFFQELNELYRATFKVVKMFHDNPVPKRCAENILNRLTKFKVAVCCQSLNRILSNQICLQILNASNSLILYYQYLSQSCLMVFRFVLEKPKDRPNFFSEAT